MKKNDKEKSEWSKALMIKCTMLWLPMTPARSRASADESTTRTPGFRVKTEAEPNDVDQGVSSVLFFKIVVVAAVVVYV